MSDTIPPLTGKDVESKDLVAENIEKLKKLFPEIVTDGKVDFETLQEVLGDFKEDSQERYSFTWNGKSKTRKLAMIPSRGTLRPAPEESVNWNSTENLFIEGDNLEVLKLLQRSYHKKVKMIYIDPPYNTGKDFIYPDDYRDNIKNYLSQTGQLDDNDKKKSSNPETSGRYHTDWLNMIYPRLKLARELLREDGAILISIDDHEVDNLKKICNEIFGEENFLVQLVWHNGEGGGGSDSKHFRIKHEYILCYAKSIENVIIKGNEINNLDRYTGKDEYFELRGPYYLQKLGMGSIRYSETLDYPIKAPDDTDIYPKDNNRGEQAAWRWSQEKLDWGMENDFVIIKKDTSGIWTVYTKQYLKVDNENKPIDRTQRPIGIIEDYSTTQASKYLKSIDLNGVFDHTKPYELISYLIERVSDTDGDYILDFFAGSGTTGHSVLNSNIRDGIIRKYICIQLPETIKENTKAFRDGYSSITDVAKDRLKKSTELLEKENPEFNGDLGFKVFKLDTSNIKSWDPNFDDVQLSLENTIKNIKTGRAEEDVLYEILLKYGLDLTLPIEERSIGIAKVYVGGAGALILCLSDNIDLDVVEGIAEIKNEYDPELMRVVFRDSGFKNDVVKTNAVQILKQHGIEDVRSI